MRIPISHGVDPGKASSRERKKTLSTADKSPPGLESRLVATTLITRIVDDGRNLDALCDRGHGIKPFLRLEPRDQALVRAIAITALRQRNRIDFVLNKLMKRPPPKNARFLIHSLHVAAAQILFMEVPESAAVNIAVTGIGNDPRTTRFKSLANAVLRRMTREKTGLLEASNQVSPLPDWLAKLLRTNYGKENTLRIASTVSREPLLDITVKSDASEWAKRLGGTVLPTGSIRLENSRPVTELEGYDDGNWWVQDAAAALPAGLVQAEKGAQVLELCAAPGGKTAQLAHSGFEVTAVDVSRPRLARLEENLKRLKLNAEIVEADILEWTPGRLYDAVLVDTPCSSTGTARRHPDVLWAKRKEDIPELAALQYRLVERAVTFLKPNGCLVFANCSMLKQEGEDLLGKLLQAFPQLRLSPVDASEIGGMSDLVNGQGALRSLPYHFPNEKNPRMGGLDGFFACRFILQ